MKRFSPVLLPTLALCLVVVGLARADTATSDLGSPDASLRTFVRAFNDADFATLMRCVQGAKPQPFFATMKTEMQHDKLAAAVTGVKLTTQGNAATADFSTTITRTGQAPAVHADRLRLTRQGAVWQIVAAAPADPDFRNGRGGPLMSFATSLIHIGELVQARDSGRETLCRANLKRLATAVAMFTQDHDNKMPAKAANFKHDVMPYVQSETVFHCAADPHATGSSYTFNSAMAGYAWLPLSSQQAKTTVMLYEGAHGQLDFRHGGRAGVAFVDGHVAMVDRAQARQLRWKP